MSDESTPKADGAPPRDRNMAAASASDSRVVRKEPTEFPVTVRTTFQPTLELEVGASEWTDLYRQGLLVPGYDGTTTSKEG